MKRLRAFFESIVFAGMRPGARPGPNQGTKWLEPLRRPMDRLLSGDAHKDPLYLTNRSLGQKVRAWAIVVAPCLLIVGLVVLALDRNYFQRAEAPAPKALTAAEVARKILPNIAKDIKIETNRDVEVVEVHVEHAAELTLMGSVKNNTATNFSAVDVVFNLTDHLGSQVGAVNGHIQNLAPKSVKVFQIPIPQRNAAFAMVREVDTSR